MQGYSSATVLGNTTRDVELKTLTGGSQVATFAVAVNKTYTTGTGEKKEEVGFFDVVVFGKLAPVVAKYVHKGDPVFASGRLQQRFWVTDDGVKKSKIEIVADVVRFLGGKKPTSDGVPDNVKGAFPDASVDDGDIPF